MTRLTTDLNQAPYWDDYDSNKQFYRILFVPKRAVQVREVNQLQTIVQEQISRFGDHIFKDGSIVAGCNITHIPRFNFVRLTTYDNANANTQVNTDTLENFLVVSANTGLRASVQLAYPGYEGTFPDTNVLYVNYLNKGTDTGNNEVATFQNNETLEIYSSDQDKFGNLNPGFLYNTISTLAANATGISYGITVGDGIVYQKGYFVETQPHTIRVRNYDTNTAGMLVGFETNESIITYLEDNSLIDPVDTANRSGIGADRLKLNPVLVAKAKTDITPTDDFYPIIDFGQSNEPVKQNTDPAYAALGDAIAKRTFEESGDYYVNPFITNTKAVANTENFAYTVNPGIGYVKGNRVELIGAVNLETPRATELGFNNANIVTVNYGNYVLVNELIGTFNADKLVTVDLYDTAQQGLTSGGGVGAPTGSKIGEAQVRAVAYNSGTKGTPDTQYRIYLTNIRMNSGQNFNSDVKSLYVSSGNNDNIAAKADIILESGNAVLKDSSASGLIFDSGVVGTRRLRDEAGVNDTQFTFRDIATATLQANGSVTFTLNTPYAGGNERFFVSPGTVTGTNKLRIDVAATAAFESDDLSGTVNGNSGNTTLSGSGTSFTSDFDVGDWVDITGAGTFRITAIASDTSATVNATISGGSGTAAYRKHFIAGTNLDLDDATITVSSNTQFIVDLNHNISSGAPQTVVASYPVIRTEANEIKKAVRRNRYVKIDCSTAGTTGPFNLGLTDIFNVSAVWIGATYSENNPNRIGWFSIDSGQQLTHYDHGKLILKPEHQGKLTSSSKILVELSHFEANTSTGIGFFSVDSYPVRAPGVTANSTNISYEDIPEVNGFNLRNAVDFRPQKVNTANSAVDANNATVNPNTTTSFSVTPQGTYLGAPDSNFQADMEYYLPRYDLIQVSSDGTFSVKSSIAEQNPKVPNVDEDAMVIASAYVPPFPGVTSSESSQYLSTKPKITSVLGGNRGYTMKDINALDKRISVLEYYQALSMLEQSAKDYTVKDENGLDRFKNGIFADPLKNHLLGDVSNFEYNIAIDEENQIARPKINKTNIDLDVYANTNITTNGRIATLAYTRELFAEQPFASKFRNVTESVWQWTGSLNLYPEYDSYQNEVAQPAINVDIDLSSPWEQFANSPFSQNFGDWRTISSDVSTNTTQTGGNWLWTGARRAGTVTTTTTTTEILERTRTNINVSTSRNKNDLGSYVTDVTMNPYMRSREVAFIATGLRPNTRVYAFFDGDPVSEHCAPGTLNQTVYDQSNNTLSLTEGKEDKVVRRISAFGTQLITDAAGNLYGIFRIPDQQFRVGERSFRIVDVDDLDIGADAILTSASARYSATSLTTTKRNLSITTIDPEVTTSTTTDRRVERSTDITRREIPPVREDPNRWDSGGENDDPLGETFPINVPQGIPGIFLEGIGVYFRSKSSTMGLTCYIVETLAGVPDRSKVVAKSYLKPVAINTSNDSSAETIFKFNDVPYLTASKSYCFFLKPDGNSPDYTIWMSEIGGIDLLTGNQIYTNPFIGVAVKSANSESWDFLQTEDIKFNLYRCNFGTTTGSLTFADQDDEYLTVDGFAMSNTNTVIQVGDVVYTEDANGNLLIANNDPTGTIQNFDNVTDTLTLDSSNGGFTPNTAIRIYRPTQAGNTATLNANTLIATATITDINDIEYSIVVPRLGTTTPTGTTVKYSFKGIDNTETEDTNWIPIQPEVELEMIDKMRVIKSTSNRSVVDKSSKIKLDLTTSSNYISPIVNLRRRNLFAIENAINNDITNEETRHGNALNRYITRIITLAEGQDAEDMKVLITAYRPATTDVHVYGKFLSADDPDNFYDKLWTKLDLTEGSGVYSSSANASDYREYGFGIPTTEEMQGTAYLNANNDGIIEYRNDSGTIFTTYKQFAIKIILTAENKQLVPRVDDVRGICLQI